MAKIQGRIEARKAAKDLEVARTTMKELKSSLGGAPLAPPKPSRRATQRNKGESEKETGATRGTKKALATQPKSKSTERHRDDALSTLKFSAIKETGAHPTSSTNDMSSEELGIALVASDQGSRRTEHRLAYLNAMLNWSPLKRNRERPCPSRHQIQ